MFEEFEALTFQALEKAKNHINMESSGRAIFFPSVKT